MWRAGSQRARASYGERTFEKYVAVLDARARTDRDLRTQLEAYLMLP